MNKTECLALVNSLIFNQHQLECYYHQNRSPSPLCPHYIQTEQYSSSKHSLLLTRSCHSTVCTFSFKVSLPGFRKLSWRPISIRLGLLARLIHSETVTFRANSLFTTTEYALHEHLAIKSLLFFLLLLIGLPEHFYPLPIPFQSFTLLPLLAIFVYLVDRVQLSYEKYRFHLTQGSELSFLVRTSCPLVSTSISVFVCL